MDSTITVAVLSLAGTLLGSALGIIASSKLTNFRLEQLEKKVDKHNCLVERTYALESDMKVLKQRIEFDEKEQ